MGATNRTDVTLEDVQQLLQAVPGEKKVQILEKMIAAVRQAISAVSRQKAQGEAVTPDSKFESWNNVVYKMDFLGNSQEIRRQLRTQWNSLMQEFTNYHALFIENHSGSQLI